MDPVKEETNQYILFVDLKEKIKAEESQQKTLRSDLEKIQKEVFELNDSIYTIDWEVKRAEFVLACEKKRHDFFYGIMEKAEDSISKDELFVRFKKFGLDMQDFRVKLENEKSELMKQLEELKR